MHRKSSVVAKKPEEEAHISFIYVVGLRCQYIRQFPQHILSEMELETPNFRVSEALLTIQAWPILDAFASLVCQQVSKYLT